MICHCVRLARSLTDWKTGNSFVNQKENTVLHTAFARNGYLCGNAERMGQLAFIKMFLLVSIPTDVNDNRRHIYIFRKGGRHLHSVAKIWIERNGMKNIEK